MDQLTNDTTLIKQTQTTAKLKRKIKKSCNECNQERDFLDESHQVCNVCFKAKTIYKPSGIKVIDEFIKFTLINCSKLAGKMEFVSYDRFKNIEFITEGGFSKLYRAVWIDGPIKSWDNK